MSRLVRWRGWNALAGMLAVALLAHIVMVVDWANLAPIAQVRAGLHHGGTGHGVAGRTPAPAPVAPGDVLSTLPCFGCHSRERYLTETRFGHAVHEAAGHCHVCHAFVPHFEVTVRKENCGGCHPE